MARGPYVTALRSVRLCRARSGSLSPFRRSEPSPARPQRARRRLPPAAAPCGYPPTVGDG